MQDVRFFQSFSRQKFCTNHQLPGVVSGKWCPLWRSLSLVLFLIMEKNKNIYGIVVSVKSDFVFYCNSMSFTEYLC